MSVRVDFLKSDIHYQMICEWWTAQKWPVIPLTHLSNLGFISYVDEIPAAAGWIYQTDSAFCLFEWIVANPKVRRAQRAEALSALIEKAKEAATAMGFLTIFISARSQPLISRLQKHGFETAENSMTNLILNIRGG